MRPMNSPRNIYIKLSPQGSQLTFDYAIIQLKIIMFSFARMANLETEDYSVKKVGLIFLFICVNLAWGQENTGSVKELKYELKKDFLDSLQWAYQGSYRQFQGWQNLILWAGAIATTGYFLDHDKRISNNLVQKNDNVHLAEFVGKGSALFNTPLFALGMYYWGRSRKDDKMVQFSKEYFSALVLALVETNLIAIIPVHDRPDQKELSFWEKVVRGQSSFPSGHTIGYAVLGFKTLQFYGPLMALLPLTFTALTGFERVHSRKHYISDIVGATFISFMASEGVRYATGYKNNHPFYKWVFEHDVALNFIRKDQAPGLMFSFSY